ncbi:MAG: methylmalonyl Co-A mutase-associated GTPase MeaB [Flavobacteriales bacterium]|nr:methylmalonyl Co-A mutase-associated GTPase MeaB [Flavobacteriales bacterium]
MKIELTLDEYFTGVKASDRSILSRAITLIESTKKEHQALAEELIQKCLPFSGNSIRIGITGVPGVGKSTFIESFGKHITNKGLKLAVLAIDPSSQKSGGSILGDKTRMEELSSNPNAFIRPTASAGSLGGVARATRETIILFETAGYDTILVETVGVGQSETTVHSMVDCFLLLLLAGAGDELQGIKRGIMEMADLISINKADGDNINAAKRAAAQVKNSIHLFPATESGWIPQVETCSAINSLGLDNIWDNIKSFENNTKNSGYFTEKRQKQAIFWMHQTIKEQLENRFYQDASIKEKLIKIEKALLNNEISSYQAAKNLLGE